MVAPAAYSQTQPDTTKSKKELRKEKRDEKRKQREAEQAEKDSLKQIRKDTTAQEPSLFSKIFRGKSEKEAQAAIDSTLRENEELNEYQREYEASLRSGNYAKAKEYLDKYQTLRDSLALARMEIEAAEWAAEQAYREAEVQEREKIIAAERADLAEEDARISRMVNLGLGGSILLIGAFVVVLVRAIRAKRKANAQLQEMNAELADKNEALSQAYEEIQAQQETLEAQHENILESIKYARRIQEAILPEQDPLKDVIQNYFIYYKPKDIVSGDFYWFHITPERTYLAAVDCTGHGVPGAFMSVLGISLLNQIVRDYPHATAGEVLNHLHAGVIHSLHQMGGGNNRGAQDGMDIALVILNKSKRSLQFAGANNPIYLVRNGEFEELKGDRSPIGGSTFTDHTFSSYDLKVSPGDRFYLFSDGLADQFGGEKGRKFSYKRLREWVSTQDGQPMKSQATDIGQVFDQWRGNHGQLDDVLVIGVQLD